MLEQKFGGLLEGIALEPDVLEWVKEALRQSQADEQQFHQEAITSLPAEDERLQARLESMYLGKLDGRVTTAFFDRHASEWRNEQSRIWRSAFGADFPVVVGHFCRSEVSC